MKKIKLVSLVAMIIGTLILTGCDNSGNSGSSGSSLFSSLLGSSDSSDLAASDSSTDTKDNNGGSDQTDSAGVPVIPADETYHYKWYDNIKINSFSNGTTITIAANIYRPVEKYAGQKFPAIVFINSWACNEYEYIAEAQKFAAKGYIVLSYSCRGWGLSGGQISMWNGDDFNDFANVVSWLIANNPVDEKNIAAAGISYGGGGALHAASRDPRIKTCAALSSHVDHYRSMFSNETPRLIWGGLLVLTSFPMGRLSSWAFNLYTYTMSGTNIDWVKEQSLINSPASYIDDMNSANKPVYMSHNFGDYLFLADFTIDYFNKLTVDHKRLDLNQGTHASHEGLSLAGIPTDTWTNVHRWMDYWLKGIDTGIVPKQQKSAVVTMERKGSISDRIVYNSDDLEKIIDGKTVYQWPANSITMKNYYLTPRSEIENGKLVETVNAVDLICKVISSYYSGATTGIPLLTELLEDFGYVYKFSADNISTEKAIVWETAPCTDYLKIRGQAEINLRLSLSYSKGQVFIYLYDVDEAGKAAFITHAFKTWWNAVPGQIMNVDLSFIAACYDVKPGHRLMVAMDTNNILYGKPTTRSYNVMIHHSSDPGRQMVFTVPYE